jgi:hypothetical protein
MKSDGRQNQTPLAAVDELDELWDDLPANSGAQPPRPEPASAEAVEDRVTAVPAEPMASLARALMQASDVELDSPHERPTLVHEPRAELRSETLPSMPEPTVSQARRKAQKPAHDGPNIELRFESLSDDLGTELLEDSMEERLSLDDLSGALELAELLLEGDREHATASRVRATCVERLSQMHIGRLGSLGAVPELCLHAEGIRWLSLDHRAGFVLSLIDGSSAVEELLDVSGMPRLETLRILVALLSQGVVRMRPGK